MKTLIKKCLICGKIIIKQPSRSLKDWNNRTKCCSPKCRFKYTGMRVKGNKWNVGKKQSGETLKKRSEAQQREKGSNWRGNNVGYAGIHTWLRKNFGKPDHCDNPECFYPRQGAQRWMTKPWRYEWALIKGKTMMRDRSYFMQLCISCHRKYDTKGRLNQTSW